MWEGRSLSDLLYRELKRTNERDRSLTAELVQGVARWGHRLRAIAQRLLDHPLKDKHRDVEALLLVGLYQLEYLRTPPHAAVSETVNASAGLGKTWARGLLNGVLRNYQRMGKDQAAIVDQDQAWRYSHPLWLVERLQQAWPDHWQQILEQANQRPPMVLRVNRTKSDRRGYAQALVEKGIAARPVSGVADAMLLDQAMDVVQLPGFGEGMISVQDGGAQLAAALLAPRDGELLLDACAAPGGKSCHLLEIAPAAQLTALDKEERRLGRLRDNLTRLGQQAEVCVGDAANPQGEWAGRSYDRILLDVPCSATGVIRRHPDIKWLRRPKDIPNLTQEQAAILDAIWPLLKPGGVLLYATCSILPEENREQVQAFLERQPDARARVIEAEWGRSDGPGRQILPGDGGMDGFYYALIEKSATAETDAGPVDAVAQSKSTLPEEGVAKAPLPEGEGLG
jgi:16S rRNA (cytosine967-C5)-methyltransferase